MVFCLLFSCLLLLLVVKLCLRLRRSRGPAEAATATTNKTWCFKKRQNTSSFFVTQNNSLLKHQNWCFEKIEGRTLVFKKKHNTKLGLMFKNKAFTYFKKCSKTGPNALLLKNEPELGSKKKYPFCCVQRTYLGGSFTSGKFHQREVSPAFNTLFFSFKNGFGLPNKARHSLRESFGVSRKHLVV